MKRGRRILFALVILFCINFVLAADANLRINTDLDSVDIQGRFKFETDSSSLAGIDSNDLAASTDYSNYSLLYSVVSSSNLIVDSRASLSSPTSNLVFSVDGGQTGEVTFSWSYSNSNYPIIFYDYGNDSSRNNVVEEFFMSGQSSYSFDYNGQPRYFSLVASYTPDSNEPDEPDAGPTGNGTCNIVSWVNTPNRQCTTGTIERQQVSNCDTYQWVSTGSNCCVPETTYGSWSSCGIDNTRFRAVTQKSDVCTYTDTKEYGACTFGCTENWQCNFGSCVNGLIRATNCVDSNSCGTTDNKPSSISCNQQGEVTSILTGGGGGGETSFLTFNKNCTIDLKCEDWSACEVQTGFNDLKTPGANNEGIRSRKCFDQNSCLIAPLFEQEKCSLKVFIKTNEIEICGEKYLGIYKENTDYLLAKIKDERVKKRLLSVEFVLGGKLKDIDCDKKVIEEFDYSTIDKIMAYTDLRKLLEVLNL